MKERADQIRARLRVESAPGKGAQILVQTDIE
jgi:nitrate/nitrite-specific signal transduction histidine kinase